MKTYEQLYKEALERARIWKEKSGMPEDKQGILDDIFPELKESKVGLEDFINSLPSNQPSEDLKKAADCYLESIQPVGFMEGDYDGSQICDAFIAGADLQKEKDSEKFFSAYIASYYDAYEDAANDFKKDVK